MKNNKIGEGFDLPLFFATSVVNLLDNPCREVYNLDEQITQLARGNCVVGSSPTLLNMFLWWNR